MRTMIRRAIEAGLVAWWTNAVLRGSTPPDDAVSHVTGGVLLPPDPPSATGQPTTTNRVSWPHAWGVLRKSGATSLRLVLPVPGDLLGLSGPAGTNAAAVGSGAALLSDTSPLCLIPEQSGLWRGWPTDPGLPGGGLGTVGEARRQMRESMVEVTAAFKSLSPDAGTMSEIQRARATRMPAAPPGVDPRAAELVSSAALVWQFTEIAIAAAMRDGSDPVRLRSLSTEARRAVAVGFSHPILEQENWDRRTAPRRGSAQRTRVSDSNIVDGP